MSRDRTSGRQMSAQSGTRLGAGARPGPSGCPGPPPSVPPGHGSTSLSPGTGGSSGPSSRYSLKNCASRTPVLDDGVPERAGVLDGEVVVRPLPVLVGAGHDAHPAPLALHGGEGSSVSWSAHCTAPPSPAPPFTGTGSTTPAPPLPARDPCSRDPLCEPFLLVSMPCTPEARPCDRNVAALGQMT